MSQKTTLLRHLKKGNHITALEAIGLFRVFNLKGRINELRNDGHDISTEMVADGTGKRYARYTLAT